MDRLLEVQVTGEPPTKGDPFDWIMAVVASFDDRTQAVIRERVRSTYAARMRRASQLSESEKQ